MTTFLKFIKLHGKVFVVAKQGDDEDTFVPHQHRPTTANRRPILQEVCADLGIMYVGVTEHGG